MRRSVGTVTLFLAVLLEFGCDRDTQVVVTFDAPDDVRSASRAIRVLVCDTESSTVLDRELVLEETADPCGSTGAAADGRVWWPVCVPVVPRGGADGRAYGIIAELRDETGAVTHRTRTSGTYVAGRRTEVEIRFEPACRGVLSCAQDESCVGGACAAAGERAEVFATCGRELLDGGVDAGPSLPAPALRFPWNGHTTGSIHAPDRALRPTFEWEAVDGATRYELEVTDECDTETFPSCAFATPTLQDTVTEPRFSVATPLEVATSAPVGRRYFWRVRACDEVVCSPFSTVRYVDVGRLGNDFNGDGYSDVVVGASRMHDRTGQAILFVGSPSGLVGPGTPVEPFGFTLETGSWYGTAVAAAGDVDADGYADAVVGANAAFGEAVGLAIVMRGGPGGLSSTSRQSALTNPEERAQLAGQMDNLFGDHAAGVGDTNGDGYADVVIGARGWDGNESGTLVPDEGRVFFWAGSRTGIGGGPSAVFRNPAPELEARFGVELASAGDVNGDGFFDVVLATQHADVPDPPGGAIEDEGSAWVFYGPFDPLPEGTRLTSGLFQPPTGPTLLPVRFGISAGGVHDLDHDGYGDLVVGASNATISGEASRGGAAFVFAGSSTGVAMTSEVRLPNPLRQDDADFGRDVALVGDVNGDGLRDVVISDTGANANVGLVRLFLGSASGLVPSTTFVNPTGDAGDSFGTVVTGLGDVDGDGFDDLAISAHRRDGALEGEGAVYVYRGTASGPSASPDQTLVAPEPSTGAEGGWFGARLSRMTP